MGINSAADLLTSLDSLFSSQDERDEKSQEKVAYIPIEEISDFPNHPFKVQIDESMAEMTDSVKRNGVLVPALVRPKTSGGYEIISGHRRKKACELACIKTIPCVVRNLTDDEAVIVMVDSNLQREKILPSEKAFAYKMKLEAMRRQTGRPSKENGVPVGHHLVEGKSREILASNSPDSNTQIQRYIRLTNLIPKLLDMVDNEKIAIRPAVEISYLTEKEQELLLETIECEESTPSHAQAIKMRDFSKDGKLNEGVILSIMQEEKPNQREKLKIPTERISRFFRTGTSAQNMEKVIIKALEMYFKRQRNMQR